MICRYIPAKKTLAEAEEWCATKKLRPMFLERGPDGLIRGMAVEIEEEPAALSNPQDGGRA